MNLYNYICNNEEILNGGLTCGGRNLELLLPKIKTNCDDLDGVEIDLMHTVNYGGKIATNLNLTKDFNVNTKYKKLQIYEIKLKAGIPEGIVVLRGLFTEK